MDRTEKLQYEQGIEQYFDQNKVYDLFEKLFKDLVINKPENPIDYLIESLKKRRYKTYIHNRLSRNIKKRSITCSSRIIKLSIFLSGKSFRNGN